MLKDKWLETHCTYNYNNYHSFGELIKKDNNEYNFKTVVIGNYDSQEYSFIENYKDNKKNGIVFERKLVEGATFSQFSAAVFKNNHVEGPYLVFKPKGYDDKVDDYDIRFSNIINDKIAGPIVEIYPNDQLFTIEKWNNNQYENRRIRFENGYLILEELNSDNKYTISHQIKCGWNYQPSNLFLHKLPSVVPNFGKNGFKPANVKKYGKIKNMNIISLE